MGLGSCLCHRNSVSVPPYSAAVSGDQIPPIPPPGIPGMPPMPGPMPGGVPGGEPGGAPGIVPGSVPGGEPGGAPGIVPGMLSGGAYGPPAHTPLPGWAMHLMSFGDSGAPGLVGVTPGMVRHAEFVGSVKQLTG